MRETAATAIVTITKRTHSGPTNTKTPLSPKNTIKAKTTPTQRHSAAIFRLLETFLEMQN